MTDGFKEAEICLENQTRRIYDSYIRVYFKLPL